MGKQPETFLAGCLGWAALTVGGAGSGFVLGAMAAPKGWENFELAYWYAIVGALIGLAAGAAAAAWAVRQLRGDGPRAPRA